MSTSLHSVAPAQGPLAGARTLFYKEVLRFWKVSFQTIAAPVLTSLLYLLIFGHVLEDHVQVHGVSYTRFLVPGLVMMALLQNAFANSSSSLIQSKITGNLVFLLVTPLSPWAWFVAYVGASVVRGLAVGVGVALGVALVSSGASGLAMAQPLWVLVFALLGAVMMGALGLIAGLWAEKFDQIAAFQNFIVMPMTFLSGVFYSVHSLPDFWKAVSHLNPFFYMIDGFRFGFFGASDVPAATSLWVVSLTVLVVCGLCVALLRAGYKIRH
jgi:ABC-2 type transport system permease protein